MILHPAVAVVAVRESSCRPDVLGAATNTVDLRMRHDTHHGAARWLLSGHVDTKPLLRLLLGELIGQELGMTPGDGQGVAEAEEGQGGWPGHDQKPFFQWFSHSPRPLKDGRG